MPASRIAPADAPYPDDCAQLFARVTPPGKEPLKLFRTMARHPRILQRMFAGSLLDQGSIPLRERELIILRTCARCRAEYEWGVHAAFFAARAGLQERELAATEAPGVSECWSRRERILIRLVDQLHDTAAVSDELWTDLSTEFSDEQLLELVALAGYYHTISFIANAARVEMEPHARRFPSRSASGAIRAWNACPSRGL